MTSDTPALDRAAQAGMQSATGRNDPRFVQVASLAHAEALRKAHEFKTATEAAREAVAAERARAAQAVREIVERSERDEADAKAQGFELAAELLGERAIVARECLAAVEAQRPPGGMSALEDAVRAYLRQGLRVNAVKHYRMATGVPLKEALLRVDEIAAGKPSSVEVQR